MRTSATVRELVVKKLPTFHRNRWFITVFTRSRNWSLLWVRKIPVHILAPYFSKIHSNIVLPSTPTSSQLFLPFGFSIQNSVCISHHSNAYYMPRPSHSPCFIIHQDISILIIQLLSDKYQNFRSNDQPSHDLAAAFLHQSILHTQPQIKGIIDDLRHKVKVKLSLCSTKHHTMKT
jgi:hypothetical protein